MGVISIYLDEGRIDGGVLALEDVHEAAGGRPLGGGDLLLGGALEAIGGGEDGRVIQ